ncbi:hypothetical protein AAKU67_002244 [Oxalobacteraceae bacterium GrIS 2.11]
MNVFIHRNFDPATGNIKKSHLLVCETCALPLWKHHDLRCPTQSPVQAGEVQDFLRRAGDWPYLADIGSVEAKTLGPVGPLAAYDPETDDPRLQRPTGPIQIVPTVGKHTQLPNGHTFIDMCIFQNRLIVLTSLGIYFLDKSGDLKPVKVEHAEPKNDTQS